jgi:hypothetical protein
MDDLIEIKADPDFIPLSDIIEEEDIKSQLHDWESSPHAGIFMSISVQERHLSMKSAQELK